MTRGLPQKGAYETVLRDALTADSLRPAGIYFGTRAGELYGSIDDGKNWKKILGGLPPIVCVKSVVVGEPHVFASVPKRTQVAARSTKKSAAAATRSPSPKSKPRQSSGTAKTKGRDSSSSAKNERRAAAPRGKSR
jgi:hypothetical protein